MASSVIHMTIASEINKVLKRDNNKMLIGSIAPDISKLLGETKARSHFLDSKENDVPNIERFLKKYRNNLNDDFVLGYFIHLYTDYFWFKNYIPSIYKEGYVTKLDGTNIKCDDNRLKHYIYNDYTNSNSGLINDYKLDMSVLDKKISLDNIIEEIPMDKIDYLISEIREIIMMKGTDNNYIFTINSIKPFIETSVKLILDKLKELNIIN